MCGIIGYVGSNQALPVLMAGLTHLTYRGYDSAGVAVVDGSALQVVKCAGKVSDLAARLAGLTLSGTTGIGHTRWATHGEPSDVNAHPHTDSAGDFAVVHNGIFENSNDLRERLRARGCVIRSQTDTELFAHLVALHYDGNFEAAVKAALGQVTGSFALVVASRLHPGTLIAAKLDTPPLVIGIGAGELFVASDISSLLRFTKRVVILEDGEMAILTPTTVHVDLFRAEPVVGRRRPASERVLSVDWPADIAERGGYPHFMLKEIEEQPRAIRDTLRDRLLADGRVMLEEFLLPPSVIRRARRVLFLGCGTAFHAGVVGYYGCAPRLGVPVLVALAGAPRSRPPGGGPPDLVIAISQSGETADTVSAVRGVQERGASVIAITNVIGSTLSRIADHVLLTRAGPEIAVASTKAFTAQIVALHLLLMYLAQFRPHHHEKLLAHLSQELRTLDGVVERVLAHADQIKAFADRLAQHNDVYFIGRNLDEPIAREGSLKLKEISYIHSEAYAAGELKHGALALLAPGTPVIAIATQSEIYEKMVSNVQEVLARKAWVAGLIADDDTELRALLTDCLVVPRVNDLLAPIPNVVALQLLAYYCGVARGCDIDQPRNLAKSVTVE
ncbi:MAG: glutamine--fructose-6-phosphate transaminase (isomerizing) [Dehalococcoidia bacterium]|nr:glutamine--fructose-6-phosphate transaminase (isomerizing) [Dehalococcoidia bacterium]